MGTIFCKLKFSSVKRLKQNLSDRFYYSLSDEAYKIEVEKHFLNSPLPNKTGSGVDVSFHKKAINKAFKLIEKKSRKSEIFEGERWLFENNYLLNNELAKKSFDDFFRLPHCQAREPRIVELARFVLLNSRFELNQERIELAIKSQNEIHSLSYLEICQLPDAFAFVLLEKLAILSQKCLLIEKLRKLSQTESSGRKDFLVSSLFRYYLGKEKGFATSEKLKFLINTVSVDLTRSVSACVTSLHKVSQLNFVTSYKPLEILEQDCDFKNMSDTTKSAYMQQISITSDKVNVNEVHLSKKIIALAKIQGVHFGEILFEQESLVEDFIKNEKIIDDEKNKKKLQKSESADEQIKNPKKADKENKKPEKMKGDIQKPSKFNLEKLAECCYVASFLLILLSLSVGIGFLLYFHIGVVASSFVAVLAFFALMPVCISFVNWLAKFFVPNKPVFKMNYEKIPMTARTLVVVSEFIASAKDVDSIVSRFNSTKALNEDENINFTLLIDTKPSDSEQNENDKQIFDALSQHENLKFLIRKKVLSVGKYRASERKRGAIETLCKALSTLDFSNFSHISFELKKPEYIVLLDDDSIVEPHAIREAVCAMLHPLNKCYDLLAFQCKINLNSIVTPYSHRFVSVSGREIYCGYSNLHFNLFGKALYCGKGIFRLDSYMQKVHDKIPNNRVLSHDVLEGAMMRTGNLSDYVFEDAPLSFKSDLSRKMRWTRGDIQNLPFVFSKKLKISIFYRLIMLINGLNSVSTIALFGLFLWATISLSLPIAIVALSIFALPFAFRLLSIVFSLSTQKISYVLADLVKLVCNIIEDAVMLPFNFAVALFGLCSSLMRMITKKKLLEWKTFGQCQNLDLDKNDCPVSKQDRETLTTYAKDFYKYFEENMVDGLISDHYQSFVDKGQVDYTSPTNIGFSMLSHICACELGFIDKAEAKSRFICTLDAVSALESWNGHLYNWYNLNSKEVLAPHFVSSVDSGNFVASLFVAKGYFSDDKILCDIIEKTISKTRFDLLYDKKRGLFFIGYNGHERKFEGHYDLLASEARILTIVAVALGIPVRAWDSLSRRHTAGCFSTLYSWSGTCFEYLLADLFLNAPKCSLLEQSSKNAVRAQRSATCKKVWGISESAYFEIDDRNNFKYKAFGINSIAMSAEREECVISPYSSFLALKFDEQKVLKNLEKIKSISKSSKDNAENTYGKYGFVESIDFTVSKHGEVVSTFMAHHQAMSLLAIINHLQNNLISDCFYRDERICSTKILMTEPKLKTRGFSKPKSKRLEQPTNNEFHIAQIKRRNLFPQFNICGEKYAVAIDDFGQGYSVCDNVFINRFRPKLFRSYGSFLYAVEGSESFSPTYAPLKVDDDFEVNFYKNKSIFCNASHRCKQEVLTSSLFCGELRRFTFKNDGASSTSFDKSNEKDKTKSRNIAIAFYSELCLNTYDADTSHQTFSNLMVATSFDEKRNVIYGTRKSRENGKGLYCALVVKGLSKITPVTSRFDFIGRNRDVSNPQILNSLANYESIEHSLGDVLEPCLGFCANIEVENDFSFDCVLCYAKTKHELEQNINYAMLPSFYDFLEKTSKNSNVNTSESIEKFARMLFSQLVYSPYPENVIRKIEKLKISIENSDSVGELKERTDAQRQAFTLSTEYRLLYYKFNGNLEQLKQVGTMVEWFLKLDIKTMLIVGYDEEDTYFESVKKTLSSMLSDTKFYLVRYYQEMWRDVAFFEITSNLFIVVNEEHFKVQSCPVEIENELVAKISSGEKDATDLLDACFDEHDNFLLEASTTTALPFSNVICLERGGTIVTENGGGFTYFENSRENKLSEFYQDPVSNPASEKLFAIGDGWFSVLNTKAQTTYTNGTIKQKFMSSEFKAEVQQYLISQGGTKVVEVKIENFKNPFNLVLSIDLALSENGKNYVFSTQNYHDTIIFRNLRNNSKMLLRAVGGKAYNNGALLFNRMKNCPMAIKNSVDSRQAVAEIVVRSAGTYTFMIGADDHIVLMQQSELKEEKKLSTDYWDNLAKIKILSPQKSLNILFNKWLPYQIVSSRFFGRCGYYQTGGAIGFRDQLQDSLAVMKLKPALAREMILNCARHQYVEGDVMHWWHGEKHGVRTRISDDKLFLPYVTYEYIKWTGDSEILNVRLPYLVSKPLEKGLNGAIREDDRYENPDVTTTSEKLIQHLEKALQSALKFGENNLLLIGGGDWNDALNDVGDDEKGESVWLSMFACIVLEQMSTFYESKSTTTMLEVREKLAQAIEKSYSIDRYKRLVTKTGEWLGEKGATVEIDIITQSFASLSNVCDKSRVNLSLDSAWIELVDEEHGIVKLLAPPIDEGYGYIASYPNGVRENGGQYTHASVWYALALINEDRIDEAYEILMMLNPIEKCRDIKLAKEYKGEPFVLAADVYSSPQHYGRMGWNWYTGSAGWYYSVVLKMLGIELRGKALILEPHIPTELDGTIVELKAFGTTAKITIRKKGQIALFLSGTKMSNLKSIELGESKNLDIEVWCI